MMAVLQVPMHYEGVARCGVMGMWAEAPRGKAGVSWLHGAVPGDIGQCHRTGASDG